MLTFCAGIVNFRSFPIARLLGVFVQLLNWYPLLAVRVRVTVSPICAVDLLLLKDPPAAGLLAVETV